MCTSFHGGELVDFDDVSVDLDGFWSGCDYSSFAGCTSWYLRYKFSTSILLNICVLRTHPLQKVTDCLSPFVAVTTQYTTRLWGILQQYYTWIYKIWISMIQWTMHKWLLFTIQFNVIFYLFILTVWYSGWNIRLWSVSVAVCRFEFHCVP